MGGMFSWFQSLFWQQEMEIAVLGCEKAGKSSFVNVINTGSFEENLMPTVGFNMRKVQKGKVTIKIWDMGGQEKFRGMWERYCRGVEVIVYVVDSADQSKFSESHKWLTLLLNKPSLAHVPLLVLLNKNDLDNAQPPESIVKTFDLNSIKNRDVSYYSISCKNKTNIDKTLEWIIKRANSSKDKS